MSVKKIVKTGVPPLVKRPSKVEENASRHISSQELLDGNQEVEIMHDGDLYRLRLTIFGKLILTK